jgi:hypothetical protein
MEFLPISNEAEVLVVLGVGTPTCTLRSLSMGSAGARAARQCRRRRLARRRCSGLDRGVVEVSVNGVRLPEDCRVGVGLT